MSYLGRFAPGAEPTVFVLCLNASEIPTAPDDCPTVTVYDSTGTVFSTLATPVAVQGQTGLFQVPLYLDGRFSEGTYTIASTYTTTSGASQRVQSDQLDVIPGGHEDGTVTAAASFALPHAHYLAYQTASGRLWKGKNPGLSG